MKLPKLIGIGYRARSGKDTVAAHLFSRHNYERVACADAIREVATIVTGEDAYDLEFKTNMTRLGVTGGQFLQQCGTLLKQIDPEIWTKVVEHNIAHRLKMGYYVVVPDIRFKSEEAMVRRLGGTLWRIDRPGLANDPHISEQEGATIQWDAVIKNNGSLADLYRAVDGLLGL